MISTVKKRYKKYLEKLKEKIKIGTSNISLKNQALKDLIGMNLQNQ